MSVSRWQRPLFLTLLLFWAFSHVQGLAQDGAAKESPAEKIRKALDQKMLIDYTGNSLQDCLNHLKEKTKVNFVIDMLVVGNVFPIEDLPMGIPGGFPGGPIAGGPAAQLHLKNDKDSRVRVGLQRMLNTYNLTYFIVDESVLITTEEVGLHRQMRQRVSVDVKDQPLRDALKDLARTTGLNMLIDPRVAKAAEGPVSIQLDDATLETAVKLLAEMGNLKAVRMGNVMFVTSEDRAEKIRREEAPVRPRHPGEGGFPGMPFGGGFGGVAPIFRNIGIAQPGIAVPDRGPPPDMDRAPPPPMDLPARPPVENRPPAAPPAPGR